MLDEYYSFLAHKQFEREDSGFEVQELNDKLFDYQKATTRWALKKGRCALFEDTGMGKTIQQLVWADEVSKRTGGSVLILAPLAVSRQTAKEAEKFGIKCKLCEDQGDVIIGVNITNYEKLHKFDTDAFSGVVLDESSIMKSYSGKTTMELQERFAYTPYRLCCTATPSPNDYTEIGATAEFLGVMTRNEMLSTFFINDSVKKGKQDRIGWRLKGHAEKDFFRWMATWSMMIDNPSNIGFDGSAFVLPKLNIRSIITDSDPDESSLFVEYAQTLSERREARKESARERVDIAAEIASEKDQCLIWCDYNYESQMLHRAIEGSVEVKGADDQHHKERAMIGFASGDVKYLVSKPSICGFGMNWQNCHEMIFCGLSDSFEQFYQAVRRCWRFGQKHDVNVYIIISEKETSVLENIKRKEADHQRMKETMICVMSTIAKEELFNAKRRHTEYLPKMEMTLPNFLQGGNENEEVCKTKDEIK